MTNDKSSCSNKCNHQTNSTLTKIEMASANDTYYTSEDGNYLRSSTGEWIFYPKKSQFSKNDLLNIVHTIDNITEPNNESNKYV